MWITEFESAMSGAYSVPSSPTTELERFCGFAERFLTTERDQPLVVEDFQEYGPVASGLPLRRLEIGA
jgi:hypothetical protein